MSKEEKKVVNLFCILAKYGSRKTVYLSHLLSNKKFTEETNLKPLIYGTTRKKKKYALDGDMYEYYSENEFKAIDDSDLIEFRSYYTLDQGTVYYFTKTESLLNADNNFICITSPYQYEQYRQWFIKQNIKCQYEKYKLFAILIEDKLRSRLYQILEETKEEDDEIKLYDICRQIIQEKNEFGDVFNRIPELKHPMVSKNVCYIDGNEFYEHDYFDDNLQDIKSFIRKNTK
jgi:guanylate kinase